MKAFLHMQRAASSAGITDNSPNLYSICLFPQKVYLLFLASTGNRFPIEMFIFSLLSTSFLRPQVPSLHEHISMALALSAQRSNPIKCPYALNLFACFRPFLFVFVFVIT